MLSLDNLRYTVGLYKQVGRPRVQLEKCHLKYRNLRWAYLLKDKHSALADLLREVFLAVRVEGRLHIVA